MQAERRLVDLYVAAGTAHPDLEPDLARFADRHLRHIAAIEATARRRATGSPTRSPAPPAETPTPPEISADPEAAVQQLRDAEAAAVDERRTDCMEAREQALATVLASIAGCEAAHERLLRRVG